MLQSLAPLPALIAAVIVGTDRSIVRELLANRATAHDRAIELRPSVVRRFRLRRLNAVGAVHPAAGNRYYLDQAGWERYSRTRRRRIMLVGLGLVIGAAILLMLRVARFYVGA